MFRITPLFTLILLASCVPAKSNRHFAKTHNLTIQKASNINLFNGSIRIEKNPKEMKKYPVYLFYNGASLKYISNDKRVANNDYIYKVQQLKDSGILLTRASMLVRYYSADTVLLRNDLVTRKTTLYDNSKVVQSYLFSYKFSSDTLIAVSYSSENELTTIFQYKPELNADFNRYRSDTQYYSNENRNSFFKKYIR